MISESAVKGLRAGHIENFIETMELNGLAGGTIRLYLSVIQRAWVHATRQAAVMCPTNHARNRPVTTGGRDRRLHDGEEERLLAVCDSGFAQVICFALATAARQGEIANLTWANVDLPGRAARLRETKNGTDRTLPVSPSMIDLLASMPRPLRGGPVFGLTAEAIKRRMIRATKRAGIENLHFHDLRHEAISRLFERTDFSDLEIARISGHKTLQMLSRYTHLRTSHLADRLAEAELRIRDGGRARTG